MSELIFKESMSASAQVLDGDSFDLDLSDTLTTTGAVLITDVLLRMSETTALRDAVSNGDVEIDLTNAVKFDGVVKISNSETISDTISSGDSETYGIENHVTGDYYITENEELSLKFSIGSQDRTVFEGDQTVSVEIVLGGRRLV